MPKGTSEVKSLSELMTPAGLKLLSASGTDLVREIGLDVVRGVVLDVLTGHNIRDSTEVLTRRRIVAINLATVDLFLKGLALSNSFISELPHLATTILGAGAPSKAERWLAQWVLGLTDKGFQNVLRDNPDALKRYRDRYIETCRQTIEKHTERSGQLRGSLAIDSGVRAEINWLAMTYLLNTIGSQTLAIRGSDKSAYGKLFEKLILGSLLHILGFKFVTCPPDEFDGVFWLSSKDKRRESDATLLYQAGKGVRFDIGFIGRGNPEISLDKVTRFEREIEIGGSAHYMATIIIVDRIGPNSSIERLAREIGACIIQMSAGYWPREVAQELNRVLGFEHKLLKMKQSRIGKFLERELSTVPLEDFIGPSSD
ncbi:MAG TPA: CfrBI family restriction endonuclease [bacterium]|nr:CfrBI family restriction endonuclease [bacterium]